MKKRFTTGEESSAYERPASRSGTTAAALSVSSTRFLLFYYACMGYAETIETGEKTRKRRVK